MQSFAAFAQRRLQRSSGPADDKLKLAASLIEHGAQPFGRAVEGRLQGLAGCVQRILKRSTAFSDHHLQVLGAPRQGLLERASLLVEAFVQVAQPVAERASDFRDAVAQDLRDLTAARVEFAGNEIEPADDAFLEGRMRLSSVLAISLASSAERGVDLGRLGGGAFR